MPTSATLKFDSNQLQFRDFFKRHSLDAPWKFALGPLLAAEESANDREGLMDKVYTVTVERVNEKNQVDRLYINFGWVDIILIFRVTGYLVVPIRLR